jgi:phage host-nuclease inhibitor protein Gam
MAQIASFEDVNKSLFHVAKCESLIAEKEAKMNAKIQKIKEAYDDETQDARLQKEVLEKDITAFCMLHKQEFEKKKSKDLLFGTVGFRTTTPKIHQLNRKYNVQATMELIKKLFKGQYIRTKEEVDKEKLLADYAQEKLDDNKMAAIGLKIDQEERFMIEIKWENIDID